MSSWIAVSLVLANHAHNSTSLVMDARQREPMFGHVSQLQELASC